MKIKRLLFENLSLKIAAIVFAVILWIFVASRGQTEVAMDAMIEYTGIPKGLEITRYVSKSTSIVLRGHETVLKNIRKGDVRINIDVSRAKKGEMTFQIRSNDVKVPFAATVTKIEPSSVKIVFEETAAKDVAVRTVITGSPADDYIVKAVTVKPAMVLIEGSKSDIKRINHIKTEPIDITGFSESFRQETGLDLGDSSLRSKTTRVDVNIIIGRKSR